MSRPTLTRPAGLVALVVLVLLLHAPVLPALWGVLVCDGPIDAADSFTHLIRIVHAAELFLPSGHHWGWDPFWYQGFVPFALYPHATYMAAAVPAVVLGLEPVSLLNWLAVTVLFLPSLIAGLLIYRSHGLAAAVLAASWIGTISSVYGAGLRGLFAYGLLSQQVGVAVFTFFAYELLVARRPIHAAAWCGVAALFHVHTMVVCALLWGGMSLVGLALRKDRLVWLWECCKAVAIGTLIAAPTIAGLIVAWDQIGPGSFFGRPHLLHVLLKGALVAPWPMVCVVLAAAALAVARGRRLPHPGSDPSAHIRPAVAFGLGTALAVASLVRLEIGVHTIDRVLFNLLHLRSLPFTFIWFAMLGVAGWTVLRTVEKRALVALTVVGVLVGWGHEYDYRSRMDCAVPVSEQAPQPGTYAALLEWISADMEEGRTYTMLLEHHIQHRPYKHPLQRLTLRLRQPVLGGHGGELTTIRNLRLAQDPTSLTCELVRRKLRRYAVGYVIGISPEAKAHFEECIGKPPVWEAEPWWVFKTRYDWTTFAARIEGFSHDPTWTELEWKLGHYPIERAVYLPVADAAPWSATADGRSIDVLRSPGDRVIKLMVPPETERLSLHYEGYPGEWLSVAVSVLALLWFVARGRKAEQRDVFRSRTGYT